MLTTQTKLNQNPSGMKVIIQRVALRIHLKHSALMRPYLSNKPDRDTNERALWAKTREKPEKPEKSVQDTRPVSNFYLNEWGARVS